MLDRTHAVRNLFVREIEFRRDYPPWRGTTEIFEILTPRFLFVTTTHGAVLLCFQYFSSEFSMIHFYPPPKPPPLPPQKLHETWQQSYDPLKFIFKLMDLTRWGK